MTTHNTFRVLTAVSVMVALTAAVQAGSVGVNFGSNRSGALLAATDTAGVVAQQNWNNAPNASGSIGDAKDGLGGLTGMGVTWTTNESWDLGGSPVTGDGKLMKGWVATHSDSSASTIALSSIPYAQYDLYLYVSHDRASEDTRFNETSVPAITNFVTVEDVTSTTVGANPFVFNEITTSGATGNYTKFTGLTQTSLSLEFYSQDDGNHRGPLSGLQIVDATPVIPEPMTMLAVGLGVAGLGRYVRRRRRG